MLQKCFTKIPLVVVHPDKCHFIGFQTVFVSFLTLQSVIFLFCYKLFFSNLKRFHRLSRFRMIILYSESHLKKTKSKIFQRFEIFRSAFFSNLKRLHDDHENRHDDQGHQRRFRYHNGRIRRIGTIQIRNDGSIRHHGHCRLQDEDVLHQSRHRRMNHQNRHQKRCANETSEQNQQIVLFQRHLCQAGMRYRNSDEQH